MEAAEAGESSLGDVSTPQQQHHQQQQPQQLQDEREVVEELQQEGVFAAVDGASRGQVNAAATPLLGLLLLAGVFFFFLSLRLPEKHNVVLRIYITRTQIPYLLAINPDLCAHMY